MATGVLVSVEEYLRSSYHPDCDYVDGEVAERNLGEFEHGSAQREILLFLTAHYPELRKRLVPEQRVQVKPTRFRIPDVCILAEGAPRQKIITIPPQLCIEILSPDDTVTRTIERIKDYFAMGVPICWIIDPVSRQGWIATPGRLEDAADGILRANGIEMPIEEVTE
jgi:Uma2 family endonuclease